MYIEEIAKLGIAAGEKTEVCRKSPVKYGLRSIQAGVFIVIATMLSQAVNATFSCRRKNDRLCRIFHRDHFGCISGWRTFYRQYHDHDIWLFAGTMSAAGRLSHLDL